MTKTIAELAEETKAAFTQQTGQLQARLNELEQRFARGPGADYGNTGHSIGQTFADDSEVKSFAANPVAGRRIHVETKAILTGATSNAAGSVGGLVNPQRDMTVPQVHRRLMVRDLLPVIRVTTGTVEYPRVKTVTNNAAMVAEGTLKPQSDMQVELVNVPIRKIAHWMLASAEILADAPQLQGIIDNELIYDLGLVEETQLLFGDGTGQNLLGMFTQASAFSAGTATTTNPNKIDALLFAILQGALADIPPTGIVVHPSDWTAMRGLKNADGDYILGPPAADVEPRLFGLPVVATKAMLAGSFLVGDFAGSATLYDRLAASVQISSEDSDNFRMNLLTLLGEERIGLAVKRATGFIAGTFAAAITDLTS